VAKKRQVGFGLLGCGGIGTAAHAKAISEVPNAKLVAAADIVPERAQAISKDYGCPWYASLEEMLKNPEVEVVDICTPTGLHAEHGIMAAKAGKHVLTEKPIDRDLAKVDKLIATCKRRGVKFGCIFQVRLTAAAQKIKQAIDKGQFGELLSGSAETMWFRGDDYYASGAWRGTLALDGGCMWNQGVHYIDLLCWMLGEPKKVLAASLATRARKIETEDIGSAQVLFRNGAVGTIRVATATYPGFPARLEICGTKGSAIMTDGVLTEFSVLGGKTEKTEAKKTGKSTASDALAVGFGGHAVQIKDFAEAILKNREPFVTGADGRRAVKLLTDIYRAAGMPEVK
jgi:predicted dehydrogenase